MRTRLIFIVGLSFFVFGLFFTRDIFAKFFWEKYGQGNMALVLVRKDSNLALQLGNFYFNGGALDLDNAVTAYKKAIKADSKILWRHYQLSRVYFVEGKYDLALEEINKEIEVNPENLRALYVRGLIYGTIGEYEKAEDDFERFTKWAPKEWAGYNDLAWVLAKQEKYKEVVEVIKKSFLEVSGGRDNPWLQNALGVAYLNLREYKKAKLAFEAAKSLADKLTIEDWFKAYPGNGRASAVDGLTAFKAAIEINLKNTAFVDN